MNGTTSAEYTATLAGIPIGRGSWVIEISEDQFTATATGGTFGKRAAFTHGHAMSFEPVSYNTGATGRSLAEIDALARAALRS